VTKATPERRYHHGDLRRAIIDTALEVMREEQNWQFTLREIARRAGVSHAAPYKHFPDKGALLTALAMIGFDQLRTDLMHARSAAGGEPRGGRCCPWRAPRSISVPTIPPFIA